MRAIIWIYWSLWSYWNFVCPLHFRELDISNDSMYCRICDQDKQLTKEGRMRAKLAWFKRRLH